MVISAIVAMSRNRVIGRNNQLPWKLPEDLKRFKMLTSGHAIIMGRKTFESIGRILPNRINIVISRQKNYQAPGAWVTSDLTEALDVARKLTPTSPELFIIGGAEIYRMAFPLLDRIYLTLIQADLEGDAFFPEFTSEEFIEVRREDRSDPFPFSFLIYNKVKKTASS